MNALPVLFADTHLVVVNKPPGLLVHRTQLDAHEQDAALQRVSQQLGRHVWPVHRLDKGTSGLLVFALNEDAARTLCQAFEAAEVRKSYLALVRGWPAPHISCQHPLARDPELPSAGQPMLAASTHFETLGQLSWPFSVDGRHASSRYAVVRARPETGRRHQIRRHLKHLAHPIVGDATHGKGAHNRAVAAHLGLQRLWLHAHTLELPHPMGTGVLHLQCPPDAHWAPVLQSCGLEASLKPGASATATMLPR
ncbi:pseudouridine synthase [Roseateles sp. BYS180W]|uniref:tRNA pseudouridine synthase C n=1 Tax=Roseateles rivi TaxID=3299028 RepID=A0ABW7FXM5_9BURK